MTSDGGNTPCQKSHLLFSCKAVWASPVALGIVAFAQFSLPKARMHSVLRKLPHSCPLNPIRATPNSANLVGPRSKNPLIMEYGPLRPQWGTLRLSRYVNPGFHSSALRAHGRHCRRPLRWFLLFSPTPKNRSSAVLSFSPCVEVNKCRAHCLNIQVELAGDARFRPHPDVGFSVFRSPCLYLCYGQQVVMCSYATLMFGSILCQGLLLVRAHPQGSRQLALHVNTCKLQCQHPFGLVQVGWE